MQQNDTIFGKIIRDEIPAVKIYEDGDFLAFLDINPVTKGHTLLIPKSQFTWIHETPDELIGPIFLQAKKIIIAMRAGLQCDYVQLSVVGNEVPHFHIHLIPRLSSDTVTMHSTPACYEDDEEMKRFAKKIQNSLQ